MKHEKLDIDRWLQVVFAIIGGTALCIYWRSWQDLPHLFYDIPSGLAISAYIGQIILEGLKNNLEGHWWARVLMLISSPRSILCMCSASTIQP